jgi:uncharacterized membrane protein
MTRHIKDIAFIGGILTVTYGLVTIMAYRDTTGFDLWPDYLKWGLVNLICCGIVAVCAYALAWSRREDGEDREA